MTKRELLTGAAGLAAAAIVQVCRAAAQDLPAHERELYQAAQRGGQVTWYTGQMQAEPSEAIGHAFTERYPRVRVNVVPWPAPMPCSRPWSNCGQTNPGPPTLLGAPSRSPIRQEPQG